MAYYAEEDIQYPKSDFSVSGQHDLFESISCNLSREEVRSLFDLLRFSINRRFIDRIHSGKDLFLAMESSGMCDDEVLFKISNAVKLIGRYDIVPRIIIQDRSKGEVDPLFDYLTHQKEIEKRANAENCHNSLKRKRPDDDDEELRELSSSSSWATRQTPRRSVCNHSSCKTPWTDICQEPSHEKPKLTCDVRLTVRAEFCSHDNALRGSVSSDKPDLTSRQLEIFAQGNTILKSRELGDAVCNIKFSEITYLDAFWRDYLNGSLLKALKGVFITDSMVEAVGNEDMMLRVQVNEEDYRKGRLMLMENLFP